MRSFLTWTLVLFMGTGLLAGVARGQDVVEIERLYLGSGEPGSTGYENAMVVENDVYHAPQYMPGLPTAAPIWPRVVEVPCTRAPTGALQCKGYEITPAYGRGEYLYFRPVVLAATPAAVLPAAEVVPPAPAVIERPAPAEPPSVRPPRRSGAGGPPPPRGRQKPDRQ